MQSRLVVLGQCRPSWCRSRVGASLLYLAGSPPSVLPTGHQSVCCHPAVGGRHSAPPSLPGAGGMESGRPKGGAFQGAQQRAEPANSDGMRSEELRGQVSPGQSWRLLSQAASGLGRLPGLSGGPARKVGTGLSSGGHRGPAGKQWGDRDWVSESLRLSGGMWLQQWKPEARAPAGRPRGVPETWRCP